MKASILIVSIAFFVASCFRDPSRAPDSTNEAYFNEVEHDWVRLPPSQRRVLLSRVIANNFVGFTPDGHMRNKAAAIAFYSSQNSSLRERLDYIRYGHFGDIVVAHGQVTAAGTSSGVKVRRIYMHVWAFSYGKWSVISSEDVEKIGSTARQPDSSASLGP
jgi:hypothetical protein